MGALLVGTRDPLSFRELGEDDVQALRSFATQVALALDRVRAQDDRAALAILADRDRIARDLHDVVIQRLFATGLTLQSAVRRVDVAVAPKLTSAIADLDSTIRDIRGTIFELEHGDASPDLRGQIREVVAAAEPMLRFHAHVALDGPLDSLVPEAVRPHLLAVLVEALSNVARHAEATKVGVSVSCVGSSSAAGTARAAGSAISNSGVLTAEVQDDGRGFAPGGRESGLRHLRDRASALGGEFAVVTAEGAGTVIRWSVPLSRASAS